ncbi:MAG: carbohydrate ABC transporter permease, partial [Candidatus Sericytochromatia bacterium]|nr:carbohydrate ABC transporter permease [Candidatus Tanganyikabacteria bacterium]
VKYRFLGRKATLAFIVALMALPPVVIIIPLFILMADLGWIDTYQAAILAEAGILIPFAVFLLYSYMKDLPPDLLDAAAVDGAGTWRQFTHIVLPLTAPALVTTAIISAVFAWNDLLIPLILWPGEDFRTLMVGLATLAPSRTGVKDAPFLMAGAAISVIPLIVAYLLGRRALVRGLLEGSGR